MTKPIPDKAEVALEYPDKLYIGTFERSARFDAHLDETGISLRLDRPGDAESLRERGFVETVAGAKFPCDYSVFNRLLELRTLAHCIQDLPFSYTTGLTNHTACSFIKIVYEIANKKCNYPMGGMK